MDGSILLPPGYRVVMPHVLVVAHLLTNTSCVPRTNPGLTVVSQHKLQICAFYVQIMFLQDSGDHYCSCLTLSHLEDRNIFTRIGVSCTQSL